MKITFTGDILIYESQDKFCRTKCGKYDYRRIFKQVKPILDESDYVVGSFETTTAGSYSRYTHSAISFNTPDDILQALKWAGFDLLTTANNHCFDRGFDGHRRTIEKINENGLEYTGTRLSRDESPYLIKNFGNTKIAFISYTYGTNSTVNDYIIPPGKEYLVNLTRPQDLPIKRPLWKRIARVMLLPLIRRKPKNNIIGDSVSSEELTNNRNDLYEKEMLDIILSAKNDADIVVFCLHSGGQFNAEVEGYTKHLFDLIANAGVNVIVCNHAHTILPIYYHKGCLIASALGNFSFAPGEGYWVDGVMADYSALLNLEIKDKKISSYDISFCKCIRDETGLAITIPISKEDHLFDVINDKLILK